VVEAQLLLELLVRLLARPPGLDQRRQPLERRVGRQVREVVLPLARGPALADQPDLLAGQVPAVAELRSLRGPHPHGGELGRERPLGPAAPGDAAPCGVLERGLGRDRVLARHGVLARPPGARHRPAQLDRGRVDVLHLRDADRPDQAAFAQAPAEGGADPVAGVRHHAAEAGAGGQHAVDLGERDRGLRPGPPVLVRHAGAGAPVRAGRPHLRQEQPQAHRHGHLAPGQGERDQDLAVGALAGGPAVLPRHPDRVSALLGQGGVVDDQHRVGAADQRVRPPDQEPPQGGVVPGRAGDEVLELVVTPQAEPGRHGLQALALAGAEQAAQVDRRPAAPLRVPQRRQERPEPAVQLLAPVRLRHRPRPTAGLR